MTRPRGRVALVNLGCPKNLVDGEILLARLRGAGWEPVDDPGEADVLVVNTCTFIDPARRESIEALLEAVAWKEARPGRRLVAAGCMVQAHAAELAREIGEIDAFVGLDELLEIDRKLAALRPSLPAPGPARRLFGANVPRLRRTPPWTAWVKIAEGCDQACAFCSIPSFRGRQRSRRVEDVLTELRRLADEGVREANLVAQDSTGWGRDLGVDDGLARLVRGIGTANGMPPWVRVHYLYPGRITPALLEALAEAGPIVEYVDLPLQHAHPAVLRRMRRPGTADSFRRQLEALENALPGAGVRTAFIVGYPGETDEEFQALLEFVEEGWFDVVGVFEYSREEGTPAAELPDDVPPEVKRERAARLAEAAEAVGWERNRARVGRELEILVEGPAEEAPGRLAARWRGQAPEVDGRVLVAAPAESPAPGAIVRARITGVRSPHELEAEVVG